MLLKTPSLVPRYTVDVFCGSMAMADTGRRGFADDAQLSPRSKLFETPTPIPAYSVVG
jgi:hypothetical protein